MSLGYIGGELVLFARHRNNKNLWELIGAVAIFLGIGLCLYFLFQAYFAHSLFERHVRLDPSAAELYQVEFWRYLLAAGASLLVPPLVLLVIKRRAGLRAMD
ncbi:hypothetical protein [Thiolapillus brandeum]|uniref:hypothetical protein n=1 Tax=Thiolapillus brandeum TaxID=1076588 RepID=UPI0011861A84|nr:hypothetical protein [Thiolapillus brandeum]